MKNKNIFAQAGLTFIALAFIIAPLLAHAETLSRSLGIGSKGSDVSSLQSFLAKDVTLYPQGLVTGYYGFLTKSAVSNFQTRNNISPVGVVGPVTLPVLNAQMAGGVGYDISAPIIYNPMVNVSRNNATVSWSTNDLAQGSVYYSTNPITAYEEVAGPRIVGAMSAITDAGVRNAQNVGLSNLSANTTYYYMISSTDQSGNVSVTVPSGTFRTTN